MHWTRHLEKNSFLHSLRYNFIYPISLLIFGSYLGQNNMNAVCQAIFALQSKSGSRKVREIGDFYNNIHHFQLINFSNMFYLNKFLQALFSNQECMAIFHYNSSICVVNKVLKGLWHILYVELFSISEWYACAIRIFSSSSLHEICWSIHWNTAAWIGRHCNVTGETIYIRQVCFLICWVIGRVRNSDVHLVAKELAE